MLYEDMKRLGWYGCVSRGAEAQRSKAVQCHWRSREDALVKGARLLPWNREIPWQVGWLQKRTEQGGAPEPPASLTQGEASVELQVGGKEAGQAGKNPAAGLPTVDLVAAVDQAVGGAPIVRLVQHPAQQLPCSDDHLRMDGHWHWVGVAPPLPYSMSY